MQHSQLDWEALQYVTAPAHINVGTFLMWNCPFARKLLFQRCLLYWCLSWYFHLEPCYAERITGKRDRMAEVV